MPTKKRTGGKKGGSNKKGGGDGDSNKEVSTINNFTSSRSPSPVNVSGSAPRSSESLKPVAATATTKSNTPFFSATNKARLLSVPASAASAATAVASTIRPSSSSSGGLVIRYLLVIIILAFLVLTLYLYLEKPKTTSIIHLYDPVTNFFNKLDRKADKSGINKLAKTIDEKKVVNNIDNKGTGAAGTSAAGTSAAGTSAAGTAGTSQQQATGIGAREKNYKKKPVIPEADDATSQTQRKPKSKSGYCFVGEDKGFRSCIEVGEGDICMSGDIFPTQAICINPNLRE
jgi:hypothetical protein